MKHSFYIFFCALFSLQVSHGMLQEQAHVQAQPNTPTKIYRCANSSLAKTRKITSKTSNCEFNRICSADQQLFIQFFALPPEIAHLVINETCDYNAQLINDFYAKPIKMLEYRSLIQDKLNNDKKLAGMISICELYLMPKEAIITLFDLTKHFKHNPTETFALTPPTVAHLCKVKQEILSCDYFKDKLAAEKFSGEKVFEHDDKYSLAKCIRYCEKHPTYQNELDITFYLCKTKKLPTHIDFLKRSIRTKRKTQRHAQELVRKHPIFW